MTKYRTVEDRQLLPRGLYEGLAEVLDSGMTAESLLARVGQVVEVMDGERENLARQKWVADMNAERCCVCDEVTGRAGESDDSIFMDLPDGKRHGPLCESCESKAQPYVEYWARHVEQLSDQNEGKI